MAYLSDTALLAIAEMDLLKRGRLSVQNVSEEAFQAICEMGSKGGWQTWPGKWNIGASGYVDSTKKQPEAGSKAESKQDLSVKAWTKRPCQEPEAESEGRRRSSRRRH